MRPDPEEPVAEHHQEGAFFCIAGISRPPAAQPGFQIVDDATAAIDLPLRGDGGQKHHVFVIASTVGAEPLIEIVHMTGEGKDNVAVRYAEPGLRG